MYIISFRYKSTRWSARRNVSLTALVLGHIEFEYGCILLEVWALTSFNILFIQSANQNSSSYNKKVKASLQLRSRSTAGQLIPSQTHTLDILQHA